MKIDFKKELKHLYSPDAKQVVVVDVPIMNFLMMDGQGDPNTPGDFQSAIEALFGLSYTIKFMIKKGAQAIDYGVMPLEGLWWADDMQAFSVDNKKDWKWTLMIMQPRVVTHDVVARAREELSRKKDLTALSRVRFESFTEGKAVHILHIGPFSAEGPTVDRIHCFIDENGFKRTGMHHEIYLSDFRRTAPEKLKTIIRQPFE
jgi:hypothetical protein